MEEIKEKLVKYNQSHLLVTYDTLTDAAKKKLLESIEKVNLKEAVNLINCDKIEEKNTDIDKIDSTAIENISKEEKERYLKIGEDVIKSKKYAVVTMAGGQGTRLGHSGPKGTYLMHLNTGDKYIFELFVDKLKEAYEKYDVYIPWYIMTSNANHMDTVNFFANNKYFGYPKEYIKFFKQGELPITTPEGDLVLETRDAVYLAADGNGGVFKALGDNGVIQELKNLKIEWVLITGIDNILVNLVDPMFIGLTLDSGTLNGVKSVLKKFPEEKVGVFCKRNGKPSVIEYSEMTDSMRYAKTIDGSLLYKDANIVNHLLNIEVLERIQKEKLPIHKAFKKLNYIDKTGECISATKPNLYKYEMFIFDYFKLLDDTLVYRIKREEEFAPVKNKEGEDSPETATKLYNALH